MKKIIEQNSYWYYPSFTYKDGVRKHLFNFYFYCYNNLDGHKYLNILEDFKDRILDRLFDE